MNFNGNSYFEIDAFQAFELVPFVVLDNAIKYSPKNGDINVHFEESDNRHLTVTVTNTGPIIQENELSTLFNRGVRGIHAAQSRIPGEGLGLYLAKSLCELNKVNITINSDVSSNFKLDGIPYSGFNLTLKFGGR